MKKEGNEKGSTISSNISWYYVEISSEEDRDIGRKEEGKKGRKGE